MQKIKIKPFIKEIKFKGNAFDFFRVLSENGAKQHSIFLESVDISPKYGRFSIGSTNPCICIAGKENRFEIKALNDLGKRILKTLKPDFGFCSSVRFSDSGIFGEIKKAKQIVSEMERLKLPSQISVIKALAFKFKADKKPSAPCFFGLFGKISYDFIDQFEELPRGRKALFAEPDYELFLVDNLFVIEHKKQKISLIANAFFEDKNINLESEKSRCYKIIKEFEKKLKQKPNDFQKTKKIKKRIIKTDTTKSQYVSMIKKLKEHILDGDVFQTVSSRTIITDCSVAPIQVYGQIRRLNPSPFMFYLNLSSGTLTGASPEIFIRVSGDSKKIVEIRPIAGTKPRGFSNGKIDPDLDSRFETELKIDKKELAEHTMLVDLARNDIAKISKPGTRFVDEPFIIEKYSHVQHLVSNVRGELRNELDCLDAYLATMNMGTLTGAPKVMAMKLLRKYEKARRGYFGGAVLYVTPFGEMDSTIIIRSIMFAKGKAFIRVGGGIVFDSVPEEEFFETERKAVAQLKAIELAEAEND